MSRMNPGMRRLRPDPDQNENGLGHPKHVFVKIDKLNMKITVSFIETVLSERGRRDMIDQFTQQSKLFRLLQNASRR